MDQIETSQQLYEILKASQDRAEYEFDPSTIKYAIYARKSTRGEERQERSIEDQIKDIMDRVVIPDGLNVVATIEERFSAKEPDTRKEFRALIENIKSGKITGLISWHPDRLSRNMKEAGELIDLLDTHTLKDLRFATSAFENNPTGKMLLGMSFVLSKQYSEHLSESVSRGNRRATEDDGEFIGKMKHGYLINADRQLVPDGNNFLIIQEAFSMRLNGAKQVEIKDWLNTQTAYRLRKYGKDPMPFKWDNDDVSKVLRDPVYAGVLKYGQSLVNLTEKYSFEPMISVKQFLKLNKIKSLDSVKIISVAELRDGVKADLLRRIVKCGHCHKDLESSLSSKKAGAGKVWYYYYRCPNPRCVNKNAGIRASVVLTFVKEFFEKYLFITQENYNSYVKEAKLELKNRTIRLDHDVKSLAKRIGDLESKYEKAKDLIQDNPALIGHYDLDKQQKLIKILTSQYQLLKTQRDGIKDSIVTFEEYLKLFQSIPVILDKMHDMRAMDIVLRNFFSNLTIKDLGRSAKQRYEIDYKLKEPYQGFLENGEFVCGRGERTRTFDLTVPNRAR